MNRILGVDPGIRGGIALLSDDGLTVEPMPVIEINKKKRINLSGLGYLYDIDHVVIEKQQSMPGQGVSSCFSIGLNYGALLGYFYASGFSLTEITPVEWKKYLKVPADKDAARYRAMQIFPNNASDFSKKSDDGLAEAALIAYYYKTRGNC